MEHYTRNRDCCCQRCTRARTMGGAVLVTLGGLFLLNEFTRFGFQWPLLLIVIGVVLVWQHAASTAGHVPPTDTYPPQTPPAQPPSPPSDPGSSQVPHV